MTAPDPRRCGWMADQPGDQPCGEPAVITVLVQTYEPYAQHGDERLLAGLMLCERHNFAAREAG